MLRCIMRAMRGMGERAIMRGSLTWMGGAVGGEESCVHVVWRRHSLDLERVRRKEGMRGRQVTAWVLF